MEIVVDCGGGAVPHARACVIDCGGGAVPSARASSSVVAGRRSAVDIPEGVMIVVAGCRRIPAVVIPEGVMVVVSPGRWAQPCQDSVLHQ